MRIVSLFVYCHLYTAQLKQRRSMMEEKYNGSLREIESLVDQFRLQITKEQQAPVENKPTKTKGKLNHCCSLYIV